MRVPVIMMIAFELLLRGAAVSHAHTHDGEAIPGENRQRPHVHFGSHANTHDAAKRHSHPHMHEHLEQHSTSAAAAGGAPEAPTDHHGPVFYVSEVPVSESVNRVRIPDSDVWVWLTSLTQPACAIVAVELSRCGVDTDLSVRPGLHVVRLPHQLQV